MSRIAKLEKLLKQDPNDAFCLYALAQEFANSDEHERACEYFDRTIEADQDYTYAYYHKSRSQQATGDVSAARKTCARGLERAREIGDEKAIAELETLHSLLH